MLRLQEIPPVLRQKAIVVVLIATGEIDWPTELEKGTGRCMRKPP